jgi:hypothetical protein
MCQQILEKEDGFFLGVNRESGTEDLSDTTGQCSTFGQPQSIPHDEGARERRQYSWEPNQKENRLLRVGIEVDIYRSVA